MAKDNRPIIVKRIKKADHGHHGGAWKIAYADFVTAMMAFFLLMWLISMTTVEQKEGLAEYFANEAVSANTSGSGAVLGGSALADSGNLMSGYSPKYAERSPPTKKSGADGSTRERAGEGAGNADASGASERNPVVTEAFHSAAASVRQALQTMPELTPFQDNVLVEVTEDGLEIVITDQWRPMFVKGSRYPLEHTRVMMAAIGPILRKLGAPVTITGHTAAGAQFPNSDYGPWELSADRANAVRAILTQNGLTDDHIASVTGRASSDPLFVDDPFMSANDRVTLSVLFPKPPMPVDWRP